MALEAGAMPYGNWSGCHAVGWDLNAPEFGDLSVGDAFQKHSYPFSVMVNTEGRRFVDEGADFRNYTYAKYGKAVLEQPGQSAWQIFDQKTIHLQRDEYKIRRVTKLKADTLEELVGKMEDMNKTQFLKTMEEYNAAVMTDVPFNPNVKDGRGTKGLELPTARRMSQVLEDELPADLHSGICVLSGPNLAKEIMDGKAASTVIAGRNPDATQQAQNALMSASFRVYTSPDVLGVELAGALKNIVALGAGIGDGMDAGENAKAAFITRGLAEMTRLGIAAGADPLTFAGLAGLGDVVATCSSRLSRNRYVGEQLAKGRSWPEIRESMDNVAEGVNATQAALVLAQELGVEMPIAEMASRVLFDGLSPQKAMVELMSRPARSEW